MVTKKRRMVAVQVCLLSAALFASAAAKKDTIRITILDSETRSLSLGGNGVPDNCDQVTFDAYCRSSRSAPLKNTLLVQEGNDPPFRVACTVESKFSRCMSLPKGESFDARKEKRGIDVYYPDDNGKVRQQLYTYVTENAKAEAAEPIAAAPIAVAPTAVAPTAVAAPAPAAAPMAKQVQVPAVAMVGSSQENVKCSFSSTPPGAEITVDGRYVGSTPSTLSLGIGNHVVQVSLGGFAQWKRDLTVSSGSELSVNAVLDKAQ